LQSWQRGSNARVIVNLAILERDVEIDADEYATAAEVEIFD
jgi:hypothetical protein